jgi:hypothetical protein
MSTYTCSTTSPLDKVVLESVAAVQGLSLVFEPNTDSETANNNSNTTTLTTSHAFTKVSRQTNGLVNACRVLWECSNNDKWLEVTAVLLDALRVHAKNEGEFFFMLRWDERDETSLL